MCDLYIIGNGFDRAHNLKTSYWDFRCYLNQYAQEFLIDLEKMYGIFPIDEDDWRIQDHLKEIKEKREERIGKILWRNFEKDLANIDEDAILGFSSSIVESLDLESGLVGIEDTLNDYWEEQYCFIQKLQDYLYKWVRQIRLSKAKPKRSTMINNSEDFFLTFNYTNTLERVYHAKPANIVHIHGGLPPYCAIRPIIGHGERKKIETNRQLAEDASNHFDEAATSIYGAIADYYTRTFKNTTRCIYNNQSFFSKLSSIDTVYVIGHSLGSVDYPYFDVVNRHVPKTAHWIVYYHSDEERGSFAKSLEEIGIPTSQYDIEHSSEFWK